jgi:hypothetical protein
MHHIPLLQVEIPITCSGSYIPKVYVVIVTQLFPDFSANGQRNPGIVAAEGDFLDYAVNFPVGGVSGQFMIIIERTDQANRNTL